MEDKLKNLNVMLRAIESRNELLHEEIERNEENIKKIENEISILLECNSNNTDSSESNVKVA